METWIQITQSDVADYLASPQLEALRTQALADGQTDPLPRVIADTTALIRARLAAIPGVRLSADAALLPPELKQTAIALIIEATQARLPALELTGDQVRRADEARDHLHTLVTSRTAITAPETAEAPTLRQGSAHIEVPVSRIRKATGDSLSGL